MLQTVKAYIETVRNENFDNYFQDYVFSLHDKDIAQGTQSIHSFAWSLQSLNGVNSAISDLEDQLKEMLDVKL